MPALKKLGLTLSLLGVLVVPLTLHTPAWAETPAQTMEKNEAEAAQVRQMHHDVLTMYHRAHDLIQQVHPEDTASLETIDKAIKNLNAPVITDGLNSSSLVMDPVFREMVRKNLGYMKMNVQPSLEKLEMMAKTMNQPVKPSTPEDFKTP